jgi:uncharacterized membrane protein
MAKIEEIATDIRILRERLVEKIPAHFTMRQVVVAFFGALFFGFTFVLKGLLLDVGLRLDAFQLTLITICTWVILTAEIYFVGYHRVPDKDKRHFGQFWAKRFFTYYFISLFVAYLLLSVYGITAIAGSAINMAKLVIAVSFPAAIGAAASDLLGKY